MHSHLKSQMPGLIECLESSGNRGRSRAPPVVFLFQPCPVRRFSRIDYLQARSAETDTPFVLAEMPAGFFLSVWSPFRESTSRTS